MLNAFRHQRFFHTRKPVYFVMVGRCSTPFGIKGSFTCNCHPEFQLRLYVLNAFRHQRFFHSSCARCQSAPGTCAQRLSASKVLSPATSKNSMGITFKCSTPFGIKGSFTQAERANLYLLACAQRLSASKVLSHVELEGVDLKTTCSTPFGIKGSFTRPGGQKNGLQEVMCSTPFGIKGSFTVPRPQPRDVGSVLNAFRHQRFFHTRNRSMYCDRKGAQRLSASKVLSRERSRAERRDRIVLNAFRHQRFFHIPTHRDCGRRYLVLNAFRHQRFFHCLFQPCPTFCGGCAQRLSASKVLSQAS